MDIQVRKLQEGDNLSQVSRLIYETDNYIFPYFFGESATSAKEILPHMIERDTIYNKGNIYVATTSDQIVAIAVVAPSPISINVSAFVEAFDDAGAMIDDAFQSVMKEYFLPMETHPKGYYIANLCVDEAYRGKGFAGALIDSIVEFVGNEGDIYLDCLADNNIALAVYEGHGFETLFSFDGFTGLKYYKLIKRAVRTEQE